MERCAGNFLAKRSDLYQPARSMKSTAKSVMRKSWRRGLVSTPEHPGHSKSMRWVASALAYEGDECQLYPFALCQNGYAQVRCDGKTTYVHQLVCECTKGPAPSRKHHAAHSCGNKPCANKRHLSWKTNSQNQLDRHADGIGFVRKLSEEHVAQIRALEGLTPIPALAVMYGVNEVTIRQIFSRKLWPTGKRAKVGFAKVPYRKGRKAA